MFFCRISVGLIQRWFNIRFIHIFIGLASFMGLMIILINLAESFSAIFASCILLSLSMGGPSGLYNLGVLECLGPKKYSIGASINETSYGLSAGIFGYLASKYREFFIVELFFSLLTRGKIFLGNYYYLFISQYFPR